MMALLCLVRLPAAAAAAEYSRQSEPKGETFGGLVGLGPKISLFISRDWRDPETYGTQSRGQEVQASPPRHTRPKKRALPAKKRKAEQPQDCCKRRVVPQEEEDTASSVRRVSRGKPPTRREAKPRNSSRNGNRWGKKIVWASALSK